MEKGIKQVMLSHINSSNKINQLKRGKPLPINQKKAEAAIYQLLEAIGEDPNREGLRDTPKRVAKMYLEMLSGLEQDAKDEFTAVFYRASRRFGDC